MEKVNLTGDNRGSQEMTSRTADSIFNVRFCVKKIDKEGNRQENEKECQIEKAFPFFIHVIDYYINSYQTILYI